MLEIQSLNQFWEMQMIQGNTGNSSDMQPLKDALNALAVDTNIATSNLRAGMLTANQTFALGSDSGALKIMLVITDGQFAGDPSVTNTLAPLLNSFSSQQVLSKVYSFDRTASVSTVLSSIACSMNATYERVNQTVLNPLWTLRSYFGILAYWRLQAQGFKPYWTKQYQDDGGLGNVSTVAYPVFAPDNYTLIGVVGSDVLVNDLGALSPGFSSALESRNPDDPVSVTYVPQSCNVSWMPSLQRSSFYIFLRQFFWLGFALAQGTFSWSE